MRRNRAAAAGRGGGHRAGGRWLHAGRGSAVAGWGRLARFTAAAAVCLTVAFALAGPGEFAALRAMPPEGWSAAAVLLLVLVAAGAISRVSPVIAGYLVLRVLFDLCGAGQPLWWGVPLLLAGAAIAAIGSLRAALADTLHTVASVGSLHLFGMAAMALGVALFARAGRSAIGHIAGARCGVAGAGRPRAVPDAAAAVRRCGGERRRHAPARPPGGTDPPHAGHRRELPGRAVRGRRAAARSRLCRFLAAVPVAARGGSDRRSWSAGADRRRCRVGRVVGRPGSPGRGAAVRRGISRRPAHAPRRRRGRRTACGPHGARRPGGSHRAARTAAGSRSAAGRWVDQGDGVPWRS